MASENCLTYSPLVEALIAATKELDEYNVPECYGIVTLLRNLDCTQRTNIDAAKALVKRLRLVDQVR
jgi:hypothetical protein